MQPSWVKDGRPSQDLAALASAEVRARPLPFMRLDPDMAPFENVKRDCSISAARLVKESRCVRVIWLLANITAVNLCFGDTLRMNLLHKTEVTIGKRVTFCLKPAIPPPCAKAPVVKQDASSAEGRTALSPGRNISSCTRSSWVIFLGNELAKRSDSSTTTFETAAV